jgi:hypothetical protein
MKLLFNKTEPQPNWAVRSHPGAKDRQLTSINLIFQDLGRFGRLNSTDLLISTVTVERKRPKISTVITALPLWIDRVRAALASSYR